jgi:thiamine biosynthesis protein ThiI
MMMKRGCPVVPVYFDTTPYTDKTSLENALHIGKVLFDWALGFPKIIYVIPHGENLKRILETRYPKFSCLLCKRLMYRISEQLAELVGAEGIVTGESIGQHASQTIVNLRVLTAVLKRYPIHRPLLGFDKVEIEKVARKIGTYTISSRKDGKCLAAPRKPSTKAKLVDVLRAEEKIGISRMVERSIKSHKVVNL